MSSLANCGFCGNACAIANGRAACTSGACAVASCNASYADCDGSPDDGCEAALNTSTANCGMCGRACTNPHGATSCVAAACVPSCSSGYANCDGNQLNGCETALNTASNCGMCGKICPANGGTPICNAGVCAIACDLTGSFALKLSIPATWPSTSVISSGNGTFVLWGKLQLTQSGNNLTGTVTTCDQVIPDFSAVVAGENYGVTYPTAIFTPTPPPPLPTSGTLSGAVPGSTLTIARSALMMGATMADPVGAWPSAASIMQLDSDADGKPGVTAPYKSGSSYRYPPVDMVATARAQSAYIASRVVFSLNGTLTSCTQSSGSAAAQDIDTHTLGCRISGGSRDCNASEQDHLDSNAPGYKTGASTFTLLKVANSATCTDVRTALP
jgi:hypothetical protein